MAKILLVDSVPGQNAALREMLESTGYSVEAVDYVDAITRLTIEKFDLVLIDVTLPDKSGFVVLERIKENHFAAKVLVITGNLRVRQELDNATLSAEEFVVKPYSTDHLLKSIEHVLSKPSEADFRLQIIKAGDFVKSTPTGELDMVASKEGLAQITTASAGLHDYTVLIDLRDVASTLSTADIYEIASELSHYGETFRKKTAIIAGGDEGLDQAAFFEDVAQNRGFNVKAFTVFEVAMEWLFEVHPTPVL